MQDPLAVILPLCSAIGYTFAALMLKRATERGVGPWRVTFIVNWTAAVLFTPWLLTGGQPFTLLNVSQAVLAGAAFFVGQVFTFLALSRGDVSLTTPILGTKVIFVALLAPWFAGEQINPTLWTSALLTCVATALLGGEFKTNSHRLVPSLIFGTSAAMAYAVTDIMQQRWGKSLGFGHFAPVMFYTIGLLSFTLRPAFSAPLSELPKRSFHWALAGGILISLQATGIAYSIATYNKVTLINILYSTRGIWSVILVWAVGHWFSNTEKAVGRSVMVRRLIGASILLVAVILGLGSR